MKYRTLHYLIITYCHTYYDIHTLTCVLISKYFIFQQDSVPVHRVKETVDLSTETPAFTPPALWLPNIPDLNLVDYKVCSVLQE